MEVLKSSIQPTITNAVLEWNVPNGYSIIDSTPKDLHCMYVGSSYTAFAFLQVTHHGGPTCVDKKSLTCSAVISGTVGEEKVQLVVKPTIHLLTAASQDMDSAFVVAQSAIWSKLMDLEQQAATCSIRGEPEEGKASVPRNDFANTECARSIHKKLVDISLLSNVPTPLTYLTNGSKSTSKRIVQVLPYERNSHDLQKDVTAIHSCHKSRHRRRNRRHYHPRYVRRCHLMSSSHASISLTSIARNTLSNFSRRLKSMVSVFLPDVNPSIADDAQMLEDEVEYQEKKGSQLQMDISYNLVYPPFYYKVEIDSKLSARGRREKVKEIPQPMDEVGSSINNESVLQSSGGNVVTEHSSEEVEISDTESDSSLDPEWDDLKAPKDILPLIHMQLHSGAWPLNRPFSYAVGVPLATIKKLPLIRKSLEHAFCSDVEVEAHFWSTALAVACFEEHFPHLPSEWDIIAFKGRRWLEHNQSLCGLTLDEVHHIARKLVSKQA